jgi:hypothetical protein
MAAEASTRPAVIDGALNYANYNLEHSQYAFLRKAQLTGSTSVSCTTTGGDMVEIEISPGFYNLSKSYLSFYTSGPAAATEFAHQHANPAPWIQKVELVGSRSGTPIETINYVNRACEFYSRRQTPLAEAMTLDCPNIDTGAPNAADGVFEGLALSTNLNARPHDMTTKQSLLSTDGAMTAGGGPLECAYVYTNTVSGATTTLAQRLTFARLFPHSFLSLNKDIYLPEPVMIRITLAPSTQVAFISTTASNTLSGVGPFTNTITLTNFYAYLCTIENPAIRQKLMDQVNGGGLKVCFEHSHNNSNTLTGTGQTLNVKLTPGLADKIKQFHWAPYNTSTNANLYYDHANLSGTSIASKIVDFYVQINGQRVNKQTYTESTADSYYEQRHKLKGSCVGSLKQFLANYGYSLYFDNNSSFLDKNAMIPESNFNDGLALADGEKQFEVFATTAGNNLNHMSYVVVSKWANITPDGIFISNN